MSVLQEDSVELFESLPVGLLIANRSKFCLDANKAACQLLERPQSSILGHCLSEFIEGEIAEADVESPTVVRDAIHSGVKLRLPDTSIRVVGSMSQPHLLHGVPCLLLTLLPDVNRSEPVQPFLTVCAWTKRIRFEDEWLSLEDYLQRAHRITVTHGISPDAPCKNKG